LKDGSNRGSKACGCRRTKEAVIEKEAMIPPDMLHDNKTLVVAKGGKANGVAYAARVG